MLQNILEFLMEKGWPVESNTPTQSIIETRLEIRKAYNPVSNLVETQYKLGHVYFNLTHVSGIAISFKNKNAYIEFNNE